MNRNEEQLLDAAAAAFEIIQTRLENEYGEEKARALLFENYDAGNDYGTVYIIPDLEEACWKYGIEPDDLGVQEIAARHYEKITLYEMD